MAAPNDNLNQSGNTERQIQSQEQGIRATAFGGINLSANPLNIPYEDSPLMRNVVTDLSGSVVKRKGTRVLYREADQEYKALTMMPISTPLAYNLLCLKNGLDLEVYEVRNNAATKALTKFNIWSSTAQNVRASWVFTSELSPRLICATGVNKPVQFTFTEGQATYNPSPVVDRVAYTDTRLQGATASNSIIWVNRQRYIGTAPSFTWTGSELRLQFPASTLTTGDVVDLTMITWQWWAEAFHWLGDRFFATQTRFNATATDQVVKVPTNLMTYLSAIETRARVWDMVVADRGDITGGAGVQTYISGSPTAATEWTYSDGSRYIPGGGNVTNPTPSFIVFGTTTGTTPTSVYFSRQRQIPFESGNNITALDIDVYVDDVQQVRYASALGSRPTYLSYGLSVVNGALVTNNTDKCQAIQFWADRLGVPQTSTVVIANNKKTHVGVSAVQAIYSNSNPDGTYVPQFGLGLFADYFNGSYPSTLTIYQDRLVLGGFSHRPTLVLFSNTSDSITPGTFYNFYQVTDDPLALQATSPFDVELPKRGSDDRVVALVEWQRSIFVLTRRASYRISPNGTAALTLTSASVTFLSATGCVNENCVVQTEGSIHYLSDNGLYDLLPRVEDGEYIAAERSIKIRKKFGLTADPLYEGLAWVAYDPDEKYVYVGYPARGNTETSVYLYVYDTSRTSWTEFDTQGYFRIFDAKPVTDRSIGNIFVAAATTEQKEVNPGRGVALNFVFLKFSETTRYVDYYEFKSKQNSIGVGEDYPAMQLPDIQIRVEDAWEQTFNSSYESLGQFRGYRYIPINDVDDLVCSFKPNDAAPFQPLVFGTDVLKKENSFYVVTQLNEGATLSFVWHPPTKEENSQGYSHMSVWYNKVDSVDWTLGGTGDPNGKVLQVPSTYPAGTFVEFGYVYCAFYESPMFFLEQLGTYKRLKHLYAFFDNEVGQDTYRDYDRNLAVSQDPEQIVDRYKVNINANITVLYNTERGGFVSSDVYGFRDIYWDDTPLDFDPSAEQAFRYSVFKESIQGVGYSYQLAVWSADDATFKLAGYQFDVKAKGKKYTSRF